MKYFNLKGHTFCQNFTHTDTTFKFKAVSDKLAKENSAKNTLNF